MKWRERRRREQAGRRDKQDLDARVKNHWLNKPMNATQRFAAYLKNGMKE